MFSNITSILRNFQSDPAGTALYLVFFAVGILFSLIIHECAHGWVALKCGDPTAKWMGRLTLDPRKHLDPIGTICMLFLRIGWAKPVPINPGNFKNYRRDYILVSMAGITVNFCIFVVSTGISAAIWKHAGAAWMKYLLQFFIMLAQMNLSLAVFNLLPVPPLDGFRLMDQFVFKGQLRLNPQTMQIIHIVFLVVCVSGTLNGLLSRINSFLFTGCLNLFLRIV